ncbi:hypothetical protein ASD15_25515 [Massilia sp. Root351]|jgi:hypothetical protein|uniref:hypothetical protein n=1 Tax=Massilia sp. Root351 TaxID=1736522 RepID=UPI000708A56E|nr:hypothetical protein [Massilia sp. Root351]KQV90039.1 hypothetical protein ASD15_25515 [Massilia sp. Root351]
MTDGKQHGSPAPAYAAFQLAKALRTSEDHQHPDTRARALGKASTWQAILDNMLSGAVAYGSRQPLEGIPEWATLDVAAGGFASGRLLAGGPLLPHEQALLATLPAGAARGGRLALNAHFLTEAGLAQLQERLRTACYQVDVPEEGALLVVAWLAAHGHAEQARTVLDQIAPFFSSLRFYPAPRDKPQRGGPQVHRQDVRATVEELRGIREHQRIQRQKEAVEIWAPLYDRMVAMFLETVAEDWPCRQYPQGWDARARALLADYATLRERHRLCGKFERSGAHSAQLREFLGRCARDPASLSGRDVGRIRLILQRYRDKRGEPGSPACSRMRSQQAADVGAPSFPSIARVVLSRLAGYPQDEGLDEVGILAHAVTAEESTRTGVPQDTAIPPSMRAKAERCLNDTIDALIERGLIGSGEVLAQVLPQMTSDIRAAGIDEPVLRQLYAAIYRAFRRHRSLLLLSMEKQVQLESLPWVAAIDRYRSTERDARSLARQTLEELAVATLAAFPQAVVPNKLIQEFDALVAGAGLQIPLVNELATDIFMGQFSPKFTAAAKVAAGLLKGSLYAAYYGIDYDEIERLPAGEKTARGADAFARICAARAGVPPGGWNPAVNGMLIEQQQILTTQNLAALCAGLHLSQPLAAHLHDMAMRCFTWMCSRQQVKAEGWHARLIVVKNTAYAWRQMLFFLALLPPPGLQQFLRLAAAHLKAQPDQYQARFAPAMQGLLLAAAGVPLDSAQAAGAGARRFLGWSRPGTSHWLLP